MANWDATKPAGSQKVRLSDDEIRVNNDALEERLAQEHDFPANPFASGSGRHKFGVGDEAARDLAIDLPTLGNLWQVLENQGSGATNRQLLQIHDGTDWIEAHRDQVYYGVTVQRPDETLVDIPVPTIFFNIQTGALEIWNGVAWANFVQQPSQPLQKRSTTEEVAKVGDPAVKVPSLIVTASSPGPSYKAVMRANVSAYQASGFPVFFYGMIDDALVTTATPLAASPNGASAFFEWEDHSLPSETTSIEYAVAAYAFSAGTFLQPSSIRVSGAVDPHPSTLSVTFHKL